MLVVAAVLPLQKFAMERFSGNELIFVWVIIEEILKYTAALIVVFWHKAVDEPIDTIIYMITIALGFSALENTLFNGTIFGLLILPNRTITTFHIAMQGRFKHHHKRAIETVS